MARFVGVLPAGAWFTFHLVLPNLIPSRRLPFLTPTSTTPKLGRDHLFQIARFSRSFFVPLQAGDSIVFPLLRYFEPPKPRFQSRLTNLRRVHSFRIGNRDVFERLSAHEHMQTDLTTTETEPEAICGGRTSSVKSVLDRGSANHQPD